MNILINASNIHSGGALQVSTSFIYELSFILKNRKLNQFKFTLLLSKKVENSLKDFVFDKSVFFKYEVFDYHPINIFNINNYTKFEKFDLVFTIFGPLFIFQKLNNHFMGFAQPWIIYPNNLVKLPIFFKILYKIKYSLLWLFFKKANLLIVESAHVRQRLNLIKNYPLEKVKVVSNCLSPAFSNLRSNNKFPKLFFNSSIKIKIGFLSRDYFHKNINFIALVSEELYKIRPNVYSLYVTLNDLEWKKKSNYFKNRIINIGEINVSKCPEFYSAIDATIFPSLLECFSATPIESFIMKKPVFSSNLSFIRSICKTHSFYYDPLDPKSAASCIDSWFFNKSASSKKKHIQLAYNYGKNFLNGKERAKNYLEIMLNDFNR